MAVVNLGGVPAPLFLDQTGLRVWMTPPPPPTPLYLKVWNRHCTGTSVEQMPLTGSMIPE